MALILHIDTALETAFVGLSRNGEFLMGFDNSSQMEHAAFVQPAILQLLNDTDTEMRNLDAVGITRGPGSYTGLRVGMSSAKGICYAIQIPLVAVSTLEVMAAAAIASSPDYDAYCPMIDARRNEVFTALYDGERKLILPPDAVLLSSGFLTQELLTKRILFFGSGAHKAKEKWITGSNAGFQNINYQQTHLSQLLFDAFKNKEFCNLAYEEPLYLKSVFFNQPKPVL